MYGDNSPKVIDLWTNVQKNDFQIAAISNCGNLAKVLQIAKQKCVTFFHRKRTRQTAHSLGKSFCVSADFCSLDDLFLDTSSKETLNLEVPPQYSSVSVMYPQMPPQCAMTNEPEKQSAVQPEELPANAVQILPDVPMLNIFRSIRLSDLMVTIPLVSPSLRELKASACRERRHLTLLLGPGAEKSLDCVISDPLFSFPNLSPVDPLSKLFFEEKYLTPAATNGIIGSLTHVSSLALSVTYFEKGEFEQIKQLLHASAGQLTKLVIVFDFGDSTLDKLLSLEDSINALGQLRHLTFWIDWWEKVPMKRRPFDLSVMAHLESFNCRFLEANELLYDSITRYFPSNQNARSIDLSPAPFCPNDWGRLLKLPPSVTRLFTRLSFGDFINEHELVQLCGLFRNLQSLDLDLDDSKDSVMSLPVLSRHLRSLSNLTKLDLYFKLEQHLEIIAQHRSRLPSGEERILEALPTVTIFKLTLRGNLHNHEQLLDLHLKQMLPNVEKLIVDSDYLYCAVCGFKGEEIFDKPDLQPRREACVQQMVAPILPLFDSLKLAQTYFEVDGKPFVIFDQQMS